jgi:flagellar FliL protein
MKLLLVGAVVLLLVALLAGGVLFLLLGGKHASDEEEEEEEVTQTEKPRRKRAAPTFTSKLGVYTVNLKAASAASQDPESPPPGLSSMYLQVEISLELDGQEADALIKNKTAQINNNINLLLSDKTGESLADRKGKERLAQEMRNEINAIIVPHVDGKEPDGPVLNVLFDKFIIQ